MLTSLAVAIAVFISVVAVAMGLSALWHLPSRVTVMLIGIGYIGGGVINLIDLSWPPR